MERIILLMIRINYVEAGEITQLMIQLRRVGVKEW